jgi:cysteine desulfurase
VFFSGGAKRLANTSCFAVPGIKAETALISLDLAGIAVSSGSACSSGKVKKSHVLEAMGVEDSLANCALRVSAGADTTSEDAERFLGAFKDIVSRVA